MREATLFAAAPGKGTRRNGASWCKRGKGNEGTKEWVWIKNRTNQRTESRKKVQGELRCLGMDSIARREQRQTAVQVIIEGPRAGFSTPQRDSVAPGERCLKLESPRSRHPMPGPTPRQSSATTLCLVAHGPRPWLRHEQTGEQSSGMHKPGPGQAWPSPSMIASPKTKRAGVRLVS